MKIWITRDKGCAHGENRVYLWKITKAPKAVKEDGTLMYQDKDAIEHNNVACVLVEEFELIFGFKPTLGSCKRFFIPVIRETS